MQTRLSLARAARLVGVSRGALQRKIQAGELPTFEGQIEAADLLRAYPGAQLEDNTVFERFARLKDDAFARRVRERVLPDPEILVARLSALSKELVLAKAEVAREQRRVEGLKDTLAGLIDNGDEPVTAARAALAALRTWLQPATAPAPAFAPLFVKDSFLRIMAAQVKVQPSNRDFFVEGNDTLLEAGLRAGLSLSYGCSNGNCGECKARVVSGEVKKVRHYDFVLGEAEKSQGYTLLCAHTAVTDLVIEADEASGAADIPLQQIAARVKAVRLLNDNMALLHLQTPRVNRLRFLAGQHATLHIGDASATHRIASCPCDDRNLEFHIPRSNDPFAQAVFSGLKSGDVVALEGPGGNFVLHEEGDRPLLFVAFGTGFAPIKSLIEHAMALNNAEALYLFWVAQPHEGHYLHNQCRAWADALDNFHYARLAYGADMAATLAPLAVARDTLARCDMYIAGPPAQAHAAAEWLRAHVPTSGIVSIDD